MDAATTGEGITDAADTIAVDIPTTVADMAHAALMVAGVPMAADITDAAALTAADAGLAAGVAEETSNHVVVAAASTAVVVADSMAAEAADSTVVADMVVEAIAKT
jgi:hypothetical protein